MIKVRFVENEIKMNDNVVRHNTALPDLVYNSRYATEVQFLHLVKHAHFVIEIEYIIQIMKDHDTRNLFVVMQKDGHIEKGLCQLISTTLPKSFIRWNHSDEEISMMEDVAKYMFPDYTDAEVVPLRNVMDELESLPTKSREWTTVVINRVYGKGTWRCRWNEPNVLTRIGMTNTYNYGPETFQKNIKQM
jgi:hypothetical protein